MKYRQAAWEKLVPTLRVQRRSERTPQYDHTVCTETQVSCIDLRQALFRMHAA